MKAIVCEMCGSNDVIKQGGMYVCQNCGTKYDPEDAKKLMVEVTIDNSAKLDNLYKIARRAYQDGNYQDAANYYQQIAIENADDWEANFYKVLSRARCCAIKDAKQELVTVSNCLDSTVRLINNSNISDVEKALNIKKICTASKNFAVDVINSVTKAFSKFGNGSSNITNMRRDTIYRAVDLIAKEELLNVAGDSKFRAKEVANCIVFLKKEDYVPNDYLYEIAKKIDPNVELPTKKSGGCYVATAVYGSYDCPQVWTLRRYRDYTLAETWYGRTFIRTYYAVSPTLVKWFGKTEWFKSMWKPKLDMMVKELNEKGVADTPYQDKVW